MHGRLIILVLLCLGMAGWGAEPAQEEAADPADERATGAQDATRARELTSMLNDGDLSPQEQAIISPWLDQY
ncbi:MAG: hypothetical protein ACE5JM_14945, partial [Armatimonadota bacterium]